MAHQLPCDGDGVCMLCKATPPDAEKLTCKTCVSAWHAACLASKPGTLAATLDWACPDCTYDCGGAPVVPAAVNPAGAGELIAAVRAIQSDKTLTESEKARRQQEIVGGKAAATAAEDEKKKKKGPKDVLDVIGGIFNCSFCKELPERPVTTSCGHNFCLKCFQKWVGQGKDTCITCRKTISKSMRDLPRINSSLVIAIRMAKMSKSNVTGGPAKIYHILHNQNRPDKAFTTERARKTGKANAASGKIFVTIPQDHFGPITAENDPERNAGVLVGESWSDRLECRQWGAHFPHVAGIAGQSGHGAQSVVLSGGYQDDEDHGEWFLYTGSGGRDLSGNKRTNKDQSFDQTFEKYNKALQVSCLKGYPVRVVRSHKEKRSSYAPETGVRYDGCYRIEKCWRKVGIQGFKVCRYLFVRCDNEPAPWTSDEHGDRPRPLPLIAELKKATDITERKQTPSWDFDEENDGCWTWKKPAPVSRLPVQSLNPDDRKTKRKAIRKAQNMTVRERLLKEFSCQICKQVMNSPMTTPCAHNFCKLCLEGCFAGKSFVNERSRGGRSLRSQKNVMKCPSCPTDISDFLQNPQVNREVMDMIESLKSKDEEEENEEVAEESSERTDDDSDNDSATHMSEETGLNDEDGEDSKTKRSPKRVKFDLGNCSSEPGDIDAEVEIPAVKNDNGLKGDSDSGNPKESNEAKAPASKRGREPATEGGAGAKTRGRKKAKQEAVADEEGNGSPSSPLQVQSDEDPKESNEAKPPAAKRGRNPAAQGVAGVKTRGRKKAENKDEAVVDNAGNSSPSSPLHVKCDEDFE